MFKPLILIPLYNHSAALPLVVGGVRKYFKDILVVDDGSTDNAKEVIKEINVPFISHKTNAGKGAAIKDGASYAKANGFTHIITIDADNQHYPEDLLKIAGKAKTEPYSIIIGRRDFNSDNVPVSSKFGRKFSAFWARVQTGKKVEDIQSGLRAYPVIIFDCLELKENRYSFEMEAVIKAIWAGFNLEEIDISVHYPVKEERISHFNALWDNIRISLLNTRLTIRALLPVPHKKYIIDENDKLKSLNPFKALKEELKRKENPKLLAVSAAWSVFWGSIALPGVRTMCLLAGLGYFNLNRPIGLTMDKLALPPFIPAICVEAGYFMRHGKWLSDFNFKTLGYQAPQRIWEWFLGSLVVAPVFSILVGFFIFFIAKFVRKGFLANAK
ncbi:MAG: glycosyltransferase family 2 protein [Elusimicrobiota bacterium]|jgi:glycosyltransferase involved in cell wall biosynthesis|nr:glycosyltransferase family 2 protein [Elusimicrobiota bacterium]